MSLQKDDIIRIIKEDQWMMQILTTVQSLQLPDWWIGAGFVQSKVWDYLHGYTNRTPLPDIDVIYFDKVHIDTVKEKEVETYLQRKFPQKKFQVRNQARMHVYHGDKQYGNAVDGLSRWVETATCIGVTLDKNHKIYLAAPHGIDDLVNLIVRPTLKQKENLEKYQKRMKEKKWKEKWPKLQIKEV